ncbi:MAG: HlyD family secretion protein [Thiomonas sp.]|uniref:HlyD family secretion protein n=1 Tax=Thiomonas arsenitoxydans (strain DSM 22701 / CIP 110005 / 3As) TaxID=426114 RepID=UPI00239ED61F|nr:efflux RND transporter periplasmic adaptor subunit [Thiomonas arsenitoxydans]MDE2269985.1 efflux RND transporter periplasmic adaptor subunit [Betaproteobacteria bacterium]HML83183.1 efflux RND transporter periplasmic adaptor subunit [Thiomonas arsenitoxydans]
MSRRRLVWTGLVAALIVAALLVRVWPPAHRWVFGPGAATNHVVVSGNIEAHQSVLSFTNVQAPITELPFDEGKAVTAGAVLARVDSRVYQQQLAIDEASLEAAARQVAVATSNLAASRSTVASDRLDFAEKQRDLQRNAGQLEAGAISRQTYDLSKTAAGQSGAVLARDEALVKVAANNIALAQANLKTAQAKVALDRVTLSFTTLRAPFSGVLAVRQAELGELAGPGVAIFTLDDLDHVWLRAYINEQDLGSIRLGEAASVTTDTYPGHVYHGRIGFIASQAEFTPKTVETHAERVTLVYRIRIDIDNPAHALLPGMPADASIALLPPEK